MRTIHVKGIFDTGYNMALMDENKTHVEGELFPLTFALTSIPTSHIQQKMCLKVILLPILI